MQTVKISNIENTAQFKVELINTLDATIATYKFWNYIGYGDNLARICGEWVNFGLLPVQMEGLEKID